MVRDFNTVFGSVVAIEIIIVVVLTITGVFDHLPGIVRMGWVMLTAITASMYSILVILGRSSSD